MRFSLLQRMSSIEQSLNQKITAALNPTFLKVVDTSNGCGANFDCLIVSDQFSGVKALQRQRLVNGACREEMPSIHAFTMKCFDPKEWETKKTELGIDN